MNTIYISLISMLISLFFGYIFIYQRKNIWNFLLKYLNKIISFGTTIFFFIIFVLAIEGLFYKLGFDADVIQWSGLISAFLIAFAWFFFDFIEIHVVINRLKK